MASALHLVKSGVRDLDFGARGKAGLVVNTVAEAGVEYGTGFMLGKLYHEHGDKWIGANAPRIAGAAGKLGALAIHMATGGRPNFLAGLLGAAGSAGVAAMGLDHGLQHARSKTGQEAVLLPKGSALPANAKKIAHIGELPPAPPGVKPQSWDQIYEMANWH